jgi:ABC-type hemin transport system substrate-binding protein
MATKKQLNDLENVVIVLEERLEKMEEEHVMLKQMLSMQTSLIDNLQMMVKMMSATTTPTAPTSSYRVMHIGGSDNETVTAQEDTNEDVVSKKQDETGEIPKNLKYKSIGSLRQRMARVV